MYKYLFLISTTFFLFSCSTDNNIENDPEETTLSAPSELSLPSRPKTSAEENLTNYEVMMVRSGYPNLESAIAGYKDESLMSEELVDIEKTPMLLQKLLIWDALVGMDWDELNSIPETNYQRMKKDIIAESGKSFCFEGLVHDIRVNRTLRPPITEALMYVPHEGYAAIVAVRSSGDILPDTYARFCGIATGKKYYQTLMGTDSAPYLFGMFDLPENK